MSAIPASGRYNNGSEYIGLYNGWSFINGVWEWIMKTKRNYEIYDKEMLAIIKGLKNWRHLLEGAKFKFEVWTDYKNLKYFIKAQNLNQWQAKWALYLSRFDFTLKHVLGTKMWKADGLSRRPDWKVGVEKDNDNQTLIKEQWICSLQEIIIKGPEVDIVEKIKRLEVRTRK